MKKIILTMFLAIAAMSVHAEEAKNDTIPVKSEEITKLVNDETTNSKGQKVTKHYFLIGGELIPTSKHVVETYNLCQKHGAKCRLAKVVNRKTNRKRIILN